jgi:hypothetical protein
MKKFFAIAVIATAFVACNNSGEKTEETKDTVTVAPADTTVVPTPADTTVVVPADTTATPQ